MAKLGEIRYTQRRTPQSLGPETAVREAASKRSVFKAVTDLGTDLSNMVAQDNVVRANADHRQRVLDYQEWAAKNPTATTEELQGWADANLEDSSAFDMVDTTNFDARGEQDLPSHLWFSLGLEAVMDASTAQSADTIQQPGARKAWEAEARSANDQILGKSIQTSANEAIDYELNRNKTEVQSAIKSGDFILANEMLNADIWQHDRVSQTLLEREAFVGEKNHELSTGMLVAQDVDDYNALLATVVDPTWNEGLSAGDTLKMAQSVITQRNAAVKADKAAETASQDAIAIDTLIGLTTGLYDMTTVNDRATQMGKANHARLITAAAVQLDQGVQTEPGTERSLTLGIHDLRSGLYEGEFSDAVRDMQVQVSTALGAVDPVTNEPRPTLSMDDASRLSKELATLKDFPYKSEGYTNTTSELRNRIMGVEEGGFSFMASDVSRAIYANAVQDLRTYVETNGGMAADLGAWRKNNMPQYLEESSKAAFIQLPEDAQDFAVWSPDGQLDQEATATAIQEDIRQQGVKLDKGDIDQGQYNTVLEAQSAYFRWLDSRSIK